MKTKSFNLAPLLAGVIVLLVAIPLGLQLYTSLMAGNAQRQTMIAQLAETRRLETERQALLEELAPWSALPAQKDALTRLMRQHMRGVAAEVVLRETKEAPQGWLVHLHEIRLEQVRPEALSAFLSACENATPPLRLAEVHVTTARSAPGRLVSARLILAELSR